MRYARDRPGYADPDDPFFTSSATDARRAGARVAATGTFGAHRIAAGADYERTQVFSESYVRRRSRRGVDAHVRALRRGSHRRSRAGGSS